MTEDSASDSEEINFGLVFPSSAESQTYVNESIYCDAKQTVASVITPIPQVN